MQEITTQLSAQHVRELVEESAIDPQVILERGYTTVGRPGAALRDPYGRDTREQLKALGFPSWATREDYYYPGLLIPQYTPSGTRYAGQWKPSRPVPNREGKPQRYASAKGPARLDVHPRWSTKGTELVPPIMDPSVRLWITEGVKKADSLTSRGEVAVALAGVYNWRNSHATLGDWEDVRIRAREIVICFDADAVTKPHVAQAMGRLGKWLRHKGAAKVWYLTVPPLENGVPKGVDDYFAAGGTVKGLDQAMESSPPKITETEDRFTDARLAETLANGVLDGSYVWSPGMEWMRFNGIRWEAVPDAIPLESVRQWSLSQFGEAVARLKLDDKTAGAEADGWRTMLSSNKASTVLKYTRGIVYLDPNVFDGDTDHINTPSGYLELDTGIVRQLGETEYPTKVTGARFTPGAQSGVWEAFLERILPDAEVRAFVQRLLGYAMLGEVREHVMPIFTGEGRNGKGTLRDAICAAFGDYALEVDPELLMTRQGHGRHGTFILELKGRRLVFCSETNKERRFDESGMKRLVGGDPLQGNRMHKDPITFLPSHTLIMCTNHLPRVSGDDPATWARILVVPFDVVIPPEERDGRLPAKLREPDVQEAILAWCYEGYRQYLAEGLNPPAAVRARTEAYRGDSDFVGRFLTERVESSPAGRVSGAALHLAYEAWYRSEGDREVPPLGRKDFTQDLARRGHVATKSHGSMVYRGLILVEPGEDD
jgi:P4 family phage/plasmid primase-like protien